MILYSSAPNNIRLEAQRAKLFEILTPIFIYLLQLILVEPCHTMVIDIDEK